MSLTFGDIDCISAMRHCLRQKRKKPRWLLRTQGLGFCSNTVAPFFFRTEYLLKAQAGVAWVFRWYVRACVRPKLLIDPHFSAYVRTPTKTHKKKKTRTQKEEQQIQQNVPSATALHESMTVHLFRVLWFNILLHAQSARMVGE
jgi:hypothetical protein